MELTIDKTNKTITVDCMFTEDDVCNFVVYLLDEHNIDANFESNSAKETIFKIYDDEPINNEIIAGITTCAKEWLLPMSSDNNGTITIKVIG